MSNFDTRFINFLGILLVLGLVSGLTACGKSNQKLYSPNGISQGVIGGEKVSEASPFSSKVIYLALGVEKQTTPFGVSVSQKGICTASAITPRILITAAHCVSQAKLGEVYAVTSVNPWSEGLIIDDWIEADQFVVHEDFKSEPSQISNDIALIHLTKDLAPNRVSKLATSKQTVSKDMEIVAIGYGHTTALTNPPQDESSQMKNQSTLLNFVLKKVENFDIASKTFSVDQGDQKGICQGDSGGPGFIYDDSKKEFFVLGVTSFVSILEVERTQRDPDKLFNNCIGRGNYTNLLQFKDWIDRAMTSMK